MEKLTRDQVLDTVKKLMNVSESRGSTPGEVANAMAAAQQLLAKHGLTMLQVEKHRLDKECPVRQDTFESSYQSLPDHVSLLALKIAKGFDCQLILGVNRRNGKRLLHFCGQEVDTAVAKYLYVRCCDELWKVTGIRARQEGYSGKSVSTYRDSFMSGAAIEIGRRLEAQRKGDVVAEPKIGALMVLKNELIDDYVTRMFPNLRVGRSLNIKTGDGFHDGVQHGRKMDLTLNGVQGKAAPSHNGYIQ